MMLVILLCSAVPIVHWWIITIDGICCYCIYIVLWRSAIVRDDVVVIVTVWHWLVFDCIWPCYDTVVHWFIMLLLKWLCSIIVVVYLYIVIVTDEYVELVRKVPIVVILVRYIFWFPLLITDIVVIDVMIWWYCCCYWMLLLLLPLKFMWCCYSCHFVDDVMLRIIPDDVPGIWR